LRREQRNELAPRCDHLSLAEDQTLSHRCKNAALCMTAKLLAEWQQWVIFVR
jgi:hypothetical protein